MSGNVVLWLVISGLTVPMALSFLLLFGSLPKTRRELKSVRAVTGGWVKAVFCESLAAPTPYIVRIGATETGPGFAYYVWEKRLFDRLQEQVGQQVTVEIGHYSAFSGRWVVSLAKATGNGGAEEHG